jgi:hypothetical protein
LAIILSAFGDITFQHGTDVLYARARSDKVDYWSAAFHQQISADS